MIWGKKEDGGALIELTKAEADALANRRALSKVVMSAHGEYRLEVKLTRRQDQSNFREMV